MYVAINKCSLTLLLHYGIRGKQIFVSCEWWSSLSSAGRSMERRLKITDIIPDCSLTAKSYFAKIRGHVFGPHGNPSGFKWLKRSVSRKFISWCQRGLRWGQAPTSAAAFTLTGANTEPLWPPFAAYPPFLIDFIHFLFSCLRRNPLWQLRRFSRH